MNDEQTNQSTIVRKGQRSCLVFLELVTIVRPLSLTSNSKKFGCGSQRKGVPDPQFRLRTKGRRRKPINKVKQGKGK